MHGIKKNIKSNDSRYKINRKLNSNNTHQFESKCVVIVDGLIRGSLPKKSAMKFANSYTEECLSQEEYYEPDIQVIEELQ